MAFLNILKYFDVRPGSPHICKKNKTPVSGTGVYIKKDAGHEACIPVILLFDQY